MFRHSYPKPNSERRGAMVIMVLVMLTVALAFAAFSVDVPYMQLVSAELQVVSDAAAKAATRKLSMTNGDTAAAIAVGKAVAAKNTVGGRQVVLEDTDFQFGNVTSNADGTFDFQATAAPYKAVRVDIDLSDNVGQGGVSTLFGSMLGSGTYSPTVGSTSAFRMHEIVLCLDRSHSMAWDDKATLDWTYPRPIPDRDYYRDYRIDSYDALLTPPLYTNDSRWAFCRDAVGDFLDQLSLATNPTDLGLVTWASYLGTNTTEYYLTRQTVPATTVEVNLGGSYSSVRQAVTDLGNRRMLGGTNTAAGLDVAINMLKNNGSFARKTIILMTDGQENEGRGSENAAADAAAAGIVIHAVTFMNGDQTRMQNVATLTGGMHIHASNGNELRKAFKYLAQLPAVSLVE